MTEPEKSYRCRGCDTTLWGATCTTCNGNGIVLIEGIGNREIETECKECRGYGCITGHNSVRRKIGTMEQLRITAKWHNYGGWVCSKECDRNSTLRMESSFPGSGPARQLDHMAAADLERRWH